MIAGLLGGSALALTTTFPEQADVFYCIAAVCMQLRLQANLLDGMVAIQSGKTSRVGELFNEIPDRVSDTAFLVGAGFSLGSNPLLGLWASLAAMATAYIRTTGKSAGAPMVFCGPMAKQHRMAVLTIAALASAILSWSTTESASRFPLMNWALWLILLGSVVTCGRRLWRIGRILRSSSSGESH
jgi:phosphatidylglycerophosphate synthase